MNKICQNSLDNIRAIFTELFREAYTKAECITIDLPYDESLLPLHHTTISMNVYVACLG